MFILWWWWWWWWWLTPFHLLFYIITGYNQIPWIDMFGYNLRWLSECWTLANIDKQWQQYICLSDFKIGNAMTPDNHFGCMTMWRTIKKKCFFGDRLMNGKRNCHHLRNYIFDIVDLYHKIYKKWGKLFPTSKHPHMSL